MKTDFLRTPEGNQRIIDTNVNVLSYLKIPVFDGDPTLNDNPDEPGAIGMKDGRIVGYNGTTWVPLGGGGDLQVTTDLGNQTSNAIIITGIGGFTGVEPGFIIANIGNNAGLIFNKPDGTTGSQLSFGDASLTFALRYQRGMFLDTTGLLVDLGGLTVKNLSAGGSTVDNSIVVWDADSGVLKYAATTNFVTLSMIGAANGVAPLNASTKIDATYLPSYVSDIVTVANFAALPSPGTAGFIYITADTNKEYRWNAGTSAYIELVPSPGTTDALAEGSTNLYYTNARVQTFGDGRYALSSNVIHNTTDETKVGSLTISDGIAYTNRVSSDGFITSKTGTNGFIQTVVNADGDGSIAAGNNAGLNAGFTGTYMYFNTGVASSNLSPNTLSGNRNWKLPDASGTIALTSDLTSYALDSNTLHTTPTDEVKTGGSIALTTAGSFPKSSITPGGLFVSDGDVDNVIHPTTIDLLNNNTGIEILLNLSQTEPSINLVGSDGNNTYLRPEGIERDIAGHASALFLWPSTSGTLALLSDITSGGISLTDLSATSPLAYNNTTGNFSINLSAYQPLENQRLSTTDAPTFSDIETTGSVHFNNGIIGNNAGYLSIIGHAGIDFYTNDGPSRPLILNGNNTIVTGTLTVGGTINSNTVEALRINDNQAYISAYGSDGIRTGYIQWTSHGALNIAAETGTSINLTGAPVYIDDALTVTGTMSSANFYATSATPTVVLGSSAVVGIGATISFSTGSTNTSGTIILHTGTGLTSAGHAFTVTNSGGFAFPNSCTPILTVNVVAGSSNNLPAIDVQTATTWGVALNYVGTTQLLPNTTYAWNYINIGQ